MADVAIMEYKTSSKDLYLVSCGWEKCGATHSYGPAIRNYYMLHFILQGQGHYYLNNKHYIKQNLQTHGLIHGFVLMAIMCLTYLNSQI